MNPYEVLGVDTDADLFKIKWAFRALSKKHHPDKGGDEETFNQVVKAYKILSDPDRRKRYDETGRVDEDKVTKEKIQGFIRDVIHNVVNAEKPDGTSDDPVWEDIQQKVLFSLQSSRGEMNTRLKKLKLKLIRAKRLKSRFKSLQEEDPVGDALKDQVDSIQQEIHTTEDAIRLSVEVSKVLEGYEYEVGPDPEGHDGPDPTLLLTSGGVRIFRA